MSSDDSGGLVSTFTSSERFATIYFYSYALVVLAILFGASYFATKVKLYHQSYFVLDNIFKQFGYIVISINGLEKKYKLEDKLNDLNTNGGSKDEMDKVESKLSKLSSIVDSNYIRLYISFVFNKIRQIIDKHETYLLKKVDNIDAKYKRRNTKTAANDKDQDGANINASERKDTLVIVKQGGNDRETVGDQFHKDASAAATKTGNNDEKESEMINSNEIETKKERKEESTNGGGITSTDALTAQALVVHVAMNESNVSVTNEEKEATEIAYFPSLTEAIAQEYNKIMNEQPMSQIKAQIDKEIQDMIGDDATNSIKSDDDRKIQAVQEFVEKQYQKHQLSNKQGFLTFFKILYKIRGLLIPALTHFFDTATDISLVWEWYLLYRLQENGEFSDYNIDMFWFFVCSLIVLIYYRISSAFEVWQFTRNKYDSFLQFLFDFFLIKLIYINIFKMKSYEPSQIIKQFRMIEGGNESAFQAILTLVFLIKTQFNEATTIAVISLVASLFSLVSRLSVLDKNGLIEKARELADFELLDVLNPCKLIGKIKYEWVIHRIYRSMDILFSIFLISLFWDVVGGQWLLILLVVGLIDIYIQYLNSGQIKTDWFNYILVINITQLKDMYEIYCDAWISVDRECGTRLIRLRLFWIRSVMIVWCILVMYSDNVVYSNEIKHIFSLLLINVHLLIILMSIYVVKALTIDDIYEKSSIENLRVFDYIGSNNEECIWFCKYLKCNIFYEATTRNIHECQCFKKEKPNVIEFSEPSNVKEALIKSGNWDNYMILEEWYYASESERGLDFGDFLKDASFSRLTFGGKIKAFRDNLPAYILLQRLGLTLVGYENVSFFLYDACKQQSLAVAQYVVLAAGSEMKYRESSRLWNNLDIAMDRKLNDNQANIAVLLWANGFNTMDMPNDQSGQIKNMLKRHFLAA